MPSRTRPLAGALLAVAAGIVLSAQSPAPQARRPYPPPYAPPRVPPHPHNGAHALYPSVIIFGGGYGVTPVATATPKHRATPRPANAPEVFETHSTTDAQ